MLISRQGEQVFGLVIPGGDEAIKKGLANRPGGADATAKEVFQAKQKERNKKADDRKAQVAKKKEERKDAREQRKKDRLVGAGTPKIQPPKPAPRKPHSKPHGIITVMNPRAAYPSALYQVVIICERC